jgi:hypothetical protein
MPASQRSRRRRVSADDDPPRAAVPGPDSGSDPDRERSPAAQAPRPTAREDAAAVQERRRDAFGGVSWVSTLVGWLAAAGLTAILAGIVTAAGAVLAVSDVGAGIGDGDAETIGLAGAVALLVVLAIAYFFGGYAAGRMARFDGPRQGVGVWVWGIVAAVVVALLAAIGGAQYNVLDALNLPRLPISRGTLTGGGAAVLVASVFVTLVAALLGGIAGERFHRKVDRFGI